ncbi:MAG: thioredoxin [Oscillospiraceae bacterium]|nr:thioredoxin [Oscillospiraceae bacterium]
MPALHISSDNFQTEVMESDKPVMIDFYADWCGPCKMFAPVVDEAADEINNAKICKINIDECPELARQFNVTHVPTVVIVNNSSVVSTQTGAISKKQIMQLLNI